jgi:hypothetical protein
MPLIPLIYLCPVTKAAVKGWIPQVPPEEGEAFEPLTCSLCNRDHLVNRLTLKTLDKVEEQAA